MDSDVEAHQQLVRSVQKSDYQQPLYPQKDFDLISKESQYEEKLRILAKQTETIGKELNDLKSEVLKLNLKRHCGTKKLEEIDKKLHMHMNKTVAFVAQRNSTYNRNGTILFTRLHLNIGNGFNQSTGVFTAPVSGVYHFYFTGRISISGIF